MQAGAKGIVGMLVNENNSHDRSVWEKARKDAQLLYLSPEMAQSDGFAQLWHNSQFRRRLLAVVVDGAHCVEEWGTDDFRPLYNALSTLRHYTGQEKPFLACTATASMATFNELWRSLAFGFRPFWGLDVGCDRNNLFYDVRALVNTKNPVLDVLDLLPLEMNNSTGAGEIPKTIIYFDSEDACRAATDTLRKCLPSHLRATIYPFSSILSERAKDQSWVRFASGEYRMLCATDAAGMGCNVADIKYIVSFGAPRTLSAVAQRWGRAGRDRVTSAVCVLIVPKWAFRPMPPMTPAAGEAIQRLKRKAKKELEPKSHTVARSKLNTMVEAFINVGHPSMVDNHPRKSGFQQAFRSL